jgi:hypothetical protein
MRKKGSRENGSKENVTYRSEKVREWYSFIASESPDLSGCGRERSNAGCDFTDYYNASHNRCTAMAPSCAVKQVDKRIASAIGIVKNRIQRSKGVNST